MKLSYRAGHTQMVRPIKTAKKPESASLPERWKKNRRHAAVVSLALVLLAGYVLVFSDSTESSEVYWLAARFTVREFIGAPQADKQIAIVEIDDKSLGKWSDPLIGWGGHMADAINQLNRSGARVIALDWTQPIETGQWLKKSYDEKLSIALSQSKGVVFVKFFKENGEYVLPTPLLLFSVPGAAEDGGESSLGYAEAGVSDSDTLWNWIQPVIGKPPQRQISFAGQVAVKSGFYRNADALPQQPILINFGNYAGTPKAPFERASLYDVATAKTPDARWKDKIVFIGATYKGCNDFHKVPFLGDWGGMRQIPGVEVQAHATKTLIDRSEIKHAQPALIWFLSSLLGAMGVLVYTGWNWARAAGAAVGIALLWVGFSLLAFIYGAYDLPLMAPLLCLITGAALMGGYRALSEERERAQTLKLWGRQQDPRIINELLANPDLSGGQGREMCVTVLFADLKNFTKTVEMLPPEQAISVLNRYLSLVAEIILRHGGWVDKYLGDGLMAQWGAPLPSEDHARLALKACLDIENQLRTMTPELYAQGEVTFEVRLTLHTGPVIVGAVGSDKRQEFTIIGDTVNVTSRLQETAKELGCNFLISEVTREFLGDTIESQIAFGKAAEVAIRGRQQPLQVYEVVAEASKLEY